MVAAGFVPESPEFKKIPVPSNWTLQGTFDKPHYTNVQMPFPFEPPHVAKDAYNDLKAYFRRFDPLHERVDAIFTKLGYIDVQHLAERIRSEVLMAITLMDNICPPSTQFAAYNKIRAKKEALIYRDFGHEGLPFFGDRTFRFMMGLKH